MVYNVIGCLENINPNIISIGKLMIDIGNDAPKDLLKGDFIAFKC